MIKDDIVMFTHTFCVIVNYLGGILLRSANYSRQTQKALVQGQCTQDKSCGKKHWS